MPKGDKYIELTSFLERCGKDLLKLTFGEIESILGCKLSDSAYKYPALWSNSESHSIAFGWLNAGYITRNVDIPNGQVEFVKSGMPPHPEERMAAKTQERPMHIAKVRNSSLLPETAIQAIEEYMHEIAIDKHGRFLSWVHCYNTFSKLRGQRDEQTIDYLSLHLAFYLASWGMYRGSTFLLQKDYKVHIPVVEILQEEKYDSLQAISADELLKKHNLDLIQDITQRIRKAYADEKPPTGKKTNDASDTLVTKILLGVYGCVPAYDQYYVKAVREYNVSSGLFNGDSIVGIAEYYIKHRSEFEALRKKISSDEIEYTPMKLMDMCMWQLGFAEEGE